MITPTGIEIREASLQEKPLIGNLMELYIYDFTEFADSDHLDETGRFGFDRLDSYWQESHRHPFLLRVDGHPAGLALVRTGIEALTGEAGVNDVTEFFVMRRYRRSRAGEAMAHHVWNRFPGRWQVREIAANRPAHAFWRTVIARYTGGRFEEMQWDDEAWRGPVQFFDNAQRTSG